ncbi:VUT family protein, partial [Acinetobacter baylyi]|uniref:VUT family protein n=1 Tax=Acinetobacter baylyi TaxID=202950 RepID=UPI001C0A5C95
HDQWNGDPRKLGALIVVAGVISYLLNPATGFIAVASVVAFCASMVADAAVYQFLRDKPWLTRVNGSNAAGALVDSVLFPTIAFGSLLPAIVLMQFAAKFSGGAIWAWILRK